MSFIDQTLMKVEHKKVKWVVKFVQKWNLILHPPSSPPLQLDMR